MHKNEKYAKIAYGAGFFFKYTNETKIYMSVVSKVLNYYGMAAQPTAWWAFCSKV